MTVYEQLQHNFDHSLQDMQEKKRRAADVVSRLAQVFQARWGFPVTALRYRSDPRDPDEQSSFLPEAKIVRGDKGEWRITMDVCIEEPSGSPQSKAHCWTYVPLCLEFLENGSLQVALADHSSELVLLSPTDSDANRQHLLEQMCEFIKKEIDETIRWIATAEGRPRRRLGVHV